MIKQQKRRNRVTALMGGLLGVLIFLLIYGVKVLDPRYVDWLLIGGDLSQHYLGWELFRLGDWRWPLGMSAGYSYPYAISVIFTDSIPLFAVLFKILWKGVSGDLQYFGFWGVFCFFLQGYWAVRILLSARLSRLEALLGSILFILSPFMIQRMFWHSALAAHFLILMSLWLFLEAENLKNGEAVRWWFLVGALCASVHIYFLAMCGCVLAAFCVRRFIAGMRKGIIPVLAAFCAGALLFLYIMGAFQSGMAAGAPGIGYYSFNLNGFFRPDDGWSRFLPRLAYYEDGQYEGFSYLGLGALLLFVLGIVSYIRKSAKREAVSAGIFALLVLIVSASNEVCFGSRVLFRYDVPELVMKVWSPFRSSGRLAWPLAYFLVYAGIIGIRNIGILPLKKAACRILLLLAIAVQIADLYPKLSEIHRNFTEEKVYENPISEKIFEALDENRIPIRHLVYLERDRYDLEEQYGFCRHALKRDMTVNDFYFARYLDLPIKAVAYDYAEYAQPDCLFVLSRDIILESYGMPLNWYRIGKNFYGLRDDIPGLSKATDQELTMQKYILKDEWLMGGYMEGETCVLPKDAYCYGPYYILPAGNYEVTVLGENLKNAQVTVSKEAAAAWLDSRLLKQNDTDLLFEFSLKERTKQIEFRMDNCGEEDMRIRAVILRRK